MTTVAFLLSSMAISNDGHGQGKIGFIMPEKVDKVQVPFEEYSNLIVIPVTINRTLTLKFILDTGAESAILTEKLFGDLMGLKYVREINVNAPGVMDSLQAFVATDIEMSLPGGITGRGINMLVLKQDYLELNKNLGEEIYGIIGYDVFSRFTINIDYDNHLLTFFEPSTYKPRRHHSKIPMNIVNTKPYISMAVKQDGKEDTVMLMVDSGASHAMLLDVEHTDDIILPNQLISTGLGHGLGGEIPGFIGRIGACGVQEFEFDELLVSIPITGAYLKAIKRGSRHGTVGGDILSRLNATFDYQGGMLYATKGDRYRDSFEYNMSGMSLGVIGSALDSLVITKIRDHSPAHEAGLQQGDVIKSINGKNLYNSSFTNLNSLLRKKEGKKIKVIYYRNDKKHKVKFQLRRLI